MGCNSSPVDGFPARDDSLAYLCNVISKEDGTFTFQSLPSGKYAVVSKLPEDFPPQLSSFRLGFRPAVRSKSCLVRGKASVDSLSELAEDFRNFNLERIFFPLPQQDSSDLQYQ